MSDSLHLEDLLNVSNASSQSKTSNSDLSDKVKLLQMYVSACEQYDPSSRSLDSSDESIHHGRNRCVSSNLQQDSQSHSTLDSFLLKSGRRHSTGGTVDTHSSSSCSTPVLHGDQQLKEKFRRGAFSSRSFSGWPCQRTPPDDVRSRPRSGSFTRPRPSDLENFEMYKTQVVSALTTGKPVWL
jgi:hypothetical protein